MKQLKLKLNKVRDNKAKARAVVGPVKPSKVQVPKTKRKPKHGRIEEEIDTAE